MEERIQGGERCPFDFRGVLFYGVLRSWSRERERGGGKREGETGESGGKGERHRDIDTETLLCEVGGRAIG